MITYCHNGINTNTANSITAGLDSQVNLVMIIKDQVMSDSGTFILSDYCSTTGRNTGDLVPIECNGNQNEAGHG